VLSRAQRVELGAQPLVVVEDLPGELCTPLEYGQNRFRPVIERVVTVAHFVSLSFDRRDLDAIPAAMASGIAGSARI
jgi:hypothetical protein